VHKEVNQILLFCDATVTYVSVFLQVRIFKNTKETGFYIPLNFYEVNPFQDPFKNQAYNPCACKDRLCKTILVSMPKNYLLFLQCLWMILGNPV